MKEHRCFNEDGQPIAKRAFKPRMNRRKAGRPRKKMITITDSKSNPFLSVPVDSPTIKSRPQRSARSRSKRIVAGKLNDELNDAEQTKQPDNKKEAEPVSVPIETHDTNTVNAQTGIVNNPTMIVKAVKENVVEVRIPETGVIETVEDKGPKLKKPKPECYVKTPPASLMEHFVTVHLTNTVDTDGNSIQAHLIPTGTSQAEVHIPGGSSAAQIQISPSPNSAFQPITILETQPVTLTVSQQEQLQSLGVQSLGVSSSDIIDIPVDIVTVSDEQAIVCSEVVSSGAADEQTYVTCDGQIEDFGTVEGDEVLHSADNLMNAAVEILPSGQVHEISLENVQ